MNGKPKMRNPEKWIGRTVPRWLNWDHHWMIIDKCDNCQKFWWTNEMHALLYPQTNADFILQKAVGVEEAQSFCPDCLAEIETDADKIDPGWRRRHGLE